MPRCSRVLVISLASLTALVLFFENSVLFIETEAETKQFLMECWVFSVKQTIWEQRW
jgi:hypothetical protein